MSEQNIKPNFNDLENPKVLIEHIEKISSSEENLLIELESLRIKPSDEIPPPPSLYKAKK